MKRFAILSLIIFSISLTIYAQDKWSPNSYSIIKETTTEVFCTSPTEYTSIEKRIISVTNERGKDAINFVVTCDKFREMKSFSGTIVDNQGNIIKKIKKNDLKKTEYSNEMASDDYYYYYDYIPIKYPITITYEWEMKIKKGYLSFPTFAPQQDYNQTVERAYYKLTTPKEITPLIHLANIPEGNISKKENQENNTIEIELLNLQPVIEETYAPPIKERIPHAFIIPAKFHFDGSNGKQSSWTELGKWQYELLEGRDILPPALLEEVLKITADCTTPLEKVKAIYDFLGRTTRYVSIQLGIGGLQPASATDVYRTGFGDCKALTNYT
ncbi:MAG: transglutaminase family protein, partial [Bacteroides sp.]|nr:transglutaminase family protein [Bacteroides sp.]